MDHLPPNRPPLILYLRAILYTNLLKNLYGPSASKSTTPHTILTGYPLYQFTQNYMSAAAHHFILYYRRQSLSDFLHKPIKMDYIDRARLVLLLLLLLLLCLADAVRDIAFISIRKRPSNAPYVAALIADIRAKFASILSNLRNTSASSCSVNDLVFFILLSSPSKSAYKFSNCLSALPNVFSKFGTVSLAGSTDGTADIRVIGVYIYKIQKT